MESLRRVVIFGVTGLVGRGLPKMLVEMGYEVVGVSRGGEQELEGVSEWVRPEEVDFRGVDGVIQLAGESVAQRWTGAVKERLWQSRVGMTRELVGRLATLAEGERPRVWVSASAVGYYGDRGEEELGEGAGRGEGYLAGLCEEWEAAAQGACEFGVRVVCVRISLVLAREAEAVRRMLAVFRLGMGGRLGGGRQWMPWIHVEDLRRLLVAGVGDDRWRGVVNGVAPGVVRNSEFTRVLARVLGRPAVMAVPCWVLRGVLGGFAGELLSSRRVRAEALERWGYEWRYEGLEAALEEVIRGGGEVR